MSSDSPTDPFGQRRQDPASVLDALQKLAIEKLKPALDAALGRVDDYLFQRSESGQDDFGLHAQHFPPGRYICPEYQYQRAG